MKEVAREGLSLKRAAWRYLKLPWSSYCYRAKEASDKMAGMVQAIIELSSKHPRYGYRRIRALLVREGWKVSRKFVQKVRRAEGLMVQPPKKKQQRRGRSTGRIPTSAEHPNHVWSWDFVADRTDEGAALRVLSLIDEFSRQFISKLTRQYLKDKGIKTLYIEPGSPWQNPYVESFHNRLRDECLNQEWFVSLAEARVVIENWRNQYNRIHPHRYLGFVSPNKFARHWQKAKQRALGCSQAPPSLHQVLFPEPTP